MSPASPHSNVQSTAHARQPHSPSDSIFALATRVFEGWTDPDTHLRVLRLRTRGTEPGGYIFTTVYHQFSCFLDGGRKVLLYHSPATPRPAGAAPEPAEVLLDLTTGQTERPFPAGYGVWEVADATKMATLYRTEGNGSWAVVWDMQAGREVAKMHTDGWILNCMSMLSDGKRAIVYRHKGSPYRERVDGRHDLLTPGEEPRTILDCEGHHCSHVVSCPADPELYAYDRWPSPTAPIDQAIRLRTLDGRYDEPLKMDERTMRPADTWGARDHYVWTPDSKRIVSYFRPHGITKPFEPGFDHFALEWWISAADWRTGEDLAAMYPPGRWGGHMQMSPDSKWIVCGGGPGFDKLFLVDLEGLRKGWNERVLCTYPRTGVPGENPGHFPYPFVLPDQSGVIFSAGWPGPDHGVYMVEWPTELRVL